ncbi:MAG TPA: T9SS type A sorting domain-containing protein [Flavobacteriaceae bacterium]|nr:T9SS type A sorting domain-containing protein [Flavobacteriaceae bacterium]
MKQQLFVICFFAMGFFVKAQETTVNLSMQSNYSDEVFYDFSTNSSQSFPAQNWEIAFLRTGDFAMATRINDGAGIEVYQASDNPADWVTIDPSNLATWTQLYNSDTTWTVGAFDNGTATYGWGEYNPMNHHVSGTVVFVLKYADGSFKKFMIEDFYGGYSFKYADWNAATSSWEADENYVLSNATNPNYEFNYFNLNTDSEVIASPEMNSWDLVFKKYTTDVGAGAMYLVTGVLQNSTVTVAENIEPNGNGDTSNLAFSEEINTVGYDWKSFTGTEYTLEADKYYYLKENDGTVYRFHFTSYDGSTTGNISFAYEDVTGQMSTVVFDSENSFSIFPNPSADKRIQVLYETSITNGENGKISVFSLTGKKVYETNLKNDGFYNQTIDLSRLSSGIYLVKIEIGKISQTKKLILK